MGSKQGSPSYYDVLGVSMDSSDDQIRRAYRKLAMVMVFFSFLLHLIIYDLYTNRF